MASDVEASYSRRAAEYTEKLGAMSSVHSSDAHLVTTWATQINGPLLDAGCGPGHWTGHLAAHGCDVRGIDQVARFIDHARSTFPHVPFELGDIDALPDAADSVGGILAWYSLIHHPPRAIGSPLSEFARVLRPGGALMLGFFVGSTVEPFDHAVVTAYRWSAEAMTGELRKAGFEVIETHTRTGLRPRPRPHGAIIARLPV